MIIDICRDMELTERELFGGALQITLPKQFRSMADFVPVPDHQEVF